MMRITSSEKKVDSLSATLLQKLRTTLLLLDANKETRTYDTIIPGVYISYHSTLISIRRGPGQSEVLNYQRATGLITLSVPCIGSMFDNKPGYMQTFIDFLGQCIYLCSPIAQTENERYLTAADKRTVANLYRRMDNILNLTHTGESVLINGLQLIKGRNGGIHLMSNLGIYIWSVYPTYAVAGDCTIARGPVDIDDIRKLRDDMDGIFSEMELQCTQLNHYLAKLVRPLLVDKVLGTGDRTWRNTFVAIDRVGDNLTVTHLPSGAYFTYNVQSKRVRFVNDFNRVWSNSPLTVTHLANLVDFVTAKETPATLSSMAS